MPLPAAFITAQAMAIGTAGYTAMLCVMALERHGVTPAHGEVIVTGAAGGVGSVAVSLLARRGYRVVASTGRPQEADYLKALGATEIIDRQTLNAPGKPLAKERWAGAVDIVGSHTLANVCAGTAYRGVVTACGLAQGMDLPASVAPFILRGISLVGIDSVQCPMPERLQAWGHLAAELDFAHIERMTRERSACTKRSTPRAICSTARSVAASSSMSTPEAIERQRAIHSEILLMNTAPISRFPVPKLEDLPEDIRSIVLAVQEKSGFVPNIFLALAHRPAEFRAFFAYHDALMERDGGLSKAEREMIVVATSGANECQYCVVAHGAILRIRARNAHVADQVAINYRKADITPRQRAMLDFAMKVSQSAQTVDERDFAALQEHGFSEEDIWDIGAISALFSLSNRFANMASVRPNDEFYLLGRASKA